MFGDDKNIDNLQQLFYELRKYVVLQRDWLLLAVTEKAVRLLAGAVLGLAMVLMGVVVLVCLSASAAWLVFRWTDSLSLAWLVVAVGVSVLAWVVFLFRKPLIVHPLTRFLADLFLK